MTQPGSSPSDLLALLARDAPESELRSHLRGLAREDGDPAEAERLADYALMLHQSQASERRRARGLALVDETAADLARRRNTDDLLAAICRRSRQLLGTDIAYVTVRDDDHKDTFVRACDGVISAELREMRLPLGVGLGGLVAQTGRPTSTADYGLDERLRHHRDIDRRVEAEGLRSLVAVPLLRGTDVFGVLLSGSRAPRSFLAEEVALFATLGTHAAIAMENAQLLADAAQAVATLGQLHAESQRRAEDLRWASETYDALAAAALNGAQVSELLAALIARLQGVVEWRDPTGTLVERHSSSSARIGQDGWVRAALLSGDESLGELRLRPTTPRGFEAEALERVAVLIVSVTLARRADSEADSRRLGMLLDELLAVTEPDATELRGRAKRAGFDLDAPHAVLVLALAQDSERWSWLNATRQARERKAVVGTTRGRIVVVDPDVNLAAAAAAWTAALTPGDTRATIGVARSAPGVVGLRDAHREADRVLNVLLALNQRGTWADTSRLGILGHMLGLGGEENLQEYISRTLDPVLEYDDVQGTDLLRTLRVFLDEGGHLANTRRALGIHINTLYGRLSRLSSILGESWNTTDRRLEIQLALKLHSLSQDLTTRAGGFRPSGPGR